VIRVAAAGDLHVGVDSRGSLRPSFQEAAARADALLLAGDLTTTGRPEEADVLAEELDGIGLPIVAVLGNHDHHADRPDEVRARLQRVGVIVLEEEACVLDLPSGTLGVAGAKGFGGGFIGACVTEFGEPETKRFVQITRSTATALGASLGQLVSDVRVALLHYAPVRDTLQGEPLEIYPFLGSYLLAEAVDTAGADLILHGHAHRGTEWGSTPAGIPVRNVAQPVIRRAFAVYTLEPRDIALASA
jgi:Icc-related predicted phosphoesterase